MATQGPDPPVAQSLPGTHLPSKNIQMPREMYEIMIARMHKQEEKLKTVADAHMMLMARDQTIKCLNEKISLLEKTSTASELRLANLVRLYQRQSGKVTSLPATAQPHTSGKTTLKQDVEMDTVEESVKDHAKSGVTSVSITSQAKPHSRTLAVPGISKELFDRVVAENIRLKELLEEQLKDSGQTVEGQLDAREYEDIIHQLRLDLSHAKDQIKSLSLVADGDQESQVLREQHADVLQRVAKMEKNLLAKQALLVSYSNEYEKLRAKNAELVAEMSRLQATLLKAQEMKETQDTQSNSESRSETSGKPAEEQPSGPSESEMEKTQKLTEEISLLKGVIQQHQIRHEEATQRYITENNLLKQDIAKMQSAVEMERSRIKDLELNISRLESENTKLADQREIQELQLKSFEEDFAQEKQERLRKDEQYEKSIRKITADRDKMTRMYQELKNKYDETSRTLQNYAARLGQTTPPSAYGGGVRQGFQQQPVMVSAGTGCADAIPRAHAPWKGTANPFGSPASIVTDCPPSLPPDQPPSGSSHSLSSGGEVSLPEGGVYVCKRCEREFKPSQKAKYEDHIKKCTDD